MDDSDRTRLLSRRTFVRTCVTVTGGALLAACTPAAPQAPTSAAAGGAAAPAFDEKAAADFYKGKTVRIVVGSPPGGGFDTYARAIARHLDKHIPGNPTVIVENMPGAAAMVSLNYLYNLAPKDGTVIGSFDGGLVTSQLFGAQGVEYDMTKLHYLGSPGGFSYVLVVTKQSGFKKVEDLLQPGAKEIVLGATPKSALENAAALLREVVGVKVKLVSGYQGTADIWLAMDGGELDGHFPPWESVKSRRLESIQNGDWIPLARWTDDPIPELPNLPSILSLVNTDEKKQILRLGVTVPNRFARPYAVLQDVPADRAQALERALAQTFADPEFLADVQKGKLDLNVLTGPEIKGLVQEFLNMPPNVKEQLRKIMV